VKTSANGQVALALYFRGRGETQYHAHALQLPALAGRTISSLTLFIGPKGFADLGLPLSLPLGARKTGRK
jgi:RNA polymerase sigma-70 factor (ECF subfamily)